MIEARALLDSKRSAHLSFWRLRSRSGISMRARKSRRRSRRWRPTQRSTSNGAVNPEANLGMGVAVTTHQNDGHPGQELGNISVELYAIRPDTLRGLVETTIHRHLPPEQFKVLKAAEASERQLLEGLVGMVGPATVMRKRRYTRSPSKPSKGVRQDRWHRASAVRLHHSIARGIEGFTKPSLSVAVHA